uniref:G-protein coupled receptors family 1 profile domain-containing protein n=1 Tax=Xenopus tropicalis TaxID=8364 RepID=A0A1B8Y424_XENTR|eukprot:XP_002942568.3 PREDICTED: alpha-1A adrenergic receptor-like [Xenopus tropicalis]
MDTNVTVTLIWPQTNRGSIAIVILTLVCFCCFLYSIIVILHIILATPHLRDNTRYLLFAHMLVNDTIYLVTGLLLFLGAWYLIYLPVPFCYFTYTVATSTYRVTPYNLAVMSLERYVAISFPLRHAEFCTVRNATVAIVVIWTVALIPNLADFITISSAFGKLRPMVCSQGALSVTPEQNTIRTLTFTISFSLVALIILFTYVKVLLVAKSIGSGKSSAIKASKTVMLHAFQLLLCMTSLLSSITERYPFNYISLLTVSTFLLFTCLPRFLSPLIYGLRDEMIRKHFIRIHSVRK